MEQIYLDHAATTFVESRVLEAMLPYISEVYANPSSFHSAGLQAKKAVDGARNSIARILNCRDHEVLFTSGGTESDNLAVIGIIRANKEKGRHVITSAIEHPAVLEPLKFLEKNGEIELTILSVDKHGLIDPKDLAAALRADTILVSIIYANNEIGTIQLIADIGREILKWRKQNKTALPYFHTDACQAAGACELDVEKLHVDTMTLNGSKIYGPKGVGLLYLRKGVNLEPLVRGGGQERGLRSGTENVPGIVGLAKALEIAQSEKEDENARLFVLRDRLIQGLLTIPKTRLNGHVAERLPNNVNISFMDTEGEAAVLYLDAQGIYVSTGSACASKSLEPSYVITALGLPYEAAHGAIRFTLGKKTSAADIERVIEVVPGVIEKLRTMSPLKLNMKNYT
ncbi:MAG: aminotransferase class V-fold PLP-dependent enzyme [Patescibacteria group bacterium]|nr:cysteine desulfurase [Patescibacteria group bacterium]MBU2509074.1 cysteine desulfurase [Patescibacteria group bacterium]